MGVHSKTSLKKKTEKQELLWEMTTINKIGDWASELGKRRSETGIFLKVLIGGNWHSVHWSYTRQIGRAFL